MPTPKTLGIGTLHARRGLGLIVGEGAQGELCQGDVILEIQGDLLFCISRIESRLNGCASCQELIMICQMLLQARASFFSQSFSEGQWS